MIKRITYGIAAAALVASTPAAADPPSLAQGTVLEAVEGFHAGDYLWAPELAPEGPVMLVINRRTQRLIAYRNGIPIGISTVSTGRRGYSTPTGVFPILQKRRVHFSSTYDNAPMPFMQRLTPRGISLHGGQLPGYPASHGCIRLPHAFAPLLFEITSVGTRVVVTDRPGAPRLGLSTDLAASDRVIARHTGAGPAVWEGERAGSGAVSIVASIADRRIIVIQAGRIVGSAPMSAPSLDAAVAFSRRGGSDGQQWQRLALPGQAASEGAPRDPFELISIDPQFRSALEPLLGGGATFLLLPDSLRAS